LLAKLTEVSTAPDRREVIMIMSEYEERFRAPAPSLHQTFATTRGRSPGRRRRRRIWVAVAAVGVLTITYKVASHHAVHSWTISQSRTTATHGQTSPMTVSDEFRLFLEAKAGERC
jgi:ferric-dicitrate binding protein FerR (iron transport regulator)